MPTVEKIMTSDPISVSFDTPATRVRSLFRDEGLRSIPVVSNNHLDGVVTRGGMLHISSAKSNLTAGGIMEHPKVIATPDMDIRDLAINILDSGVVYAPVVESADSMELKGIITVADILKILLKVSEPRDETIDGIYTKDVVGCDYRDLIFHVWNRMDETGFSGLPVMKKGKIIGIITRKDIINSGNVRINRESDDMRRSTLVEKIMKTPPLVVTPGTSTRKTAELLLEYNIGRLPVVKNPLYIKNEPERAKKADLIGIVSREDILWSYVG